MLEHLLGNRNIEKVLFYLLKNEKGYATEMSRRCGGAISPIQRALDRLEQGGIVVGKPVGRTRVYQFNPRYPFLPELTQLLRKAYDFLPEELRTKCYEPERRQRPRKRGKPL